MGLSYYHGIIDINMFPEELSSDAESILSESFKYYCKNSKNSPQIESKLELSDDSPENNFLIKFSLHNNFVKIHKIITIKVKKHQKTIEDFIKDQTYQIDELEKEIINVKNLNNILVTDNKTIKEDYQKLIEENKLVKEDISSLRDLISKLILKFDTVTNQKVQPVNNGFMQSQSFTPTTNTGFTIGTSTVPNFNTTANISNPIPTQLLTPVVHRVIPPFTLPKSTTEINTSETNTITNSFSDLLTKSNGFVFQKK